MLLFGQTYMRQFPRVLKMLELKNIFSNKISIVGAGKLGQAIAKGFLKSEKIPANQITLTRRKRKALSPFKKQGLNHHILF